LNQLEVNEYCKHDAAMAKHYGLFNPSGPTAREGDGYYYGMTFSPLELIFIKTNRDMSPHLIDYYTDWILHDIYKHYPYRSTSFNYSFTNKTNHTRVP
jgi:hypothetical protein